VQIEKPTDITLTVVPAPGLKGPLMNLEQVRLIPIR